MAEWTLCANLAIPNGWNQADGAKKAEHVYASNALGQHANPQDCNYHPEDLSNPCDVLLVLDHVAQKKIATERIQQEGHLVCYGAPLPVEKHESRCPDQRPEAKQFVNAPCRALEQALFRLELCRQQSNKTSQDDDA